MSQSAVVARAEARLRQLCCLGLPGPVIAPKLFSELNAVIPFETCIHMWVGADGPVDAYFNAPETGASFALYRDRFFGRREGEVWPTMAEAIRNEIGPHHVNEVLRISRTSYHRHPIFNEVLRPCRGEVFIRMLIRDNRTPAGAFTIARLAHDRDFDAGDLRALRRLEPFIAHALRSRATTVGPETCGADRALIVVDANGTVRWRSPQAGRLLSLANGNAGAPATMPVGMLRAVRALRTVTAGSDATTPTWQHDNAWGSFVARAFPLDPVTPAESLIGIELERRVPSSLKLFEAIRDAAMPPRQAEVCLLLALGRTQEQIAERLHISRNTVIYHRRQIYNQFGAESRDELRQRLLSRVSRA